MNLSKSGVLPVSHNTEIVDATCPIAEIRTGVDLGRRAAHYREKSAAAVIEVARCVYAAHDRWYAPWQKVGRPGVKLKERINAERQWNDFLGECGWNFKKHAKLIRRYAQIGRRANLLSANSANLPGCLETLAAITDPKIPEEGVSRLAAGLTPEFTTRDAKRAVQALGAGDAAQKPDPEALNSSPPGGDTVSSPAVANRSGSMTDRALKIDLSEENAVVVAVVVALADLLDISNVKLPKADLFDGRLAKAVTALKASSEFQSMGELLSKLKTDLNGEALESAFGTYRRSTAGRRKQPAFGLSRSRIRSVA